MKATNDTPVWWLAQYGLATNDGGAMADSDGDGMSNYAEWKAGTCPTNGNSKLQVTSFRLQDGSNLTIQWSSVLGKSYTIQGTINVLAGFSETVSNGIAGTGGTNTCVLSAGQVPRKFYRVMVVE